MASPRMVPEEELNKLKRRLEQTEEELRKEKEKSKQLKAVVATDVQFRPRRETIRLILPDFAKAMDRNQQKFTLFSDPIEIAGFQWKLRACRMANNSWLGLFLSAYSPNSYEGPFEFEVDCSLRLFHTFSSKDIHKEANGTINRLDHYEFGSTGFVKFAEIKNLLAQKSGFLRGDGSVQVEADFTVKTATFEHFLVDPGDTVAIAGNNEGSSSD